MKNKSEELNGHNSLSKFFNLAPSATSHPPLPCKLNSVRNSICEKKRCQGNGMMEQRPGTGKHVQGEEKTRTGSEFMLAKGKGRYRVGRKKIKKNYERMLKKKQKHQQ